MDAPAQLEIEEEEIPIDPTLAGLDRIGACPQESRDLEVAATGGLTLDPTEVLAQVEHRRSLFVLVTSPDPAGAVRVGAEPPSSPDDPRNEVVPETLWLMEISRRDESGRTLFRRARGVRLYEHFVGNDIAQDVSGIEGCELEPSLRARDLDHDGEVELTVIAAGSDQPHRNMVSTLAFLVGADDFEVQARFSRCHHWDRFEAGTEREFTDETTWIVRDVNGDGHADLHVVERWRSREVYDGVDSSRSGDRRETDCLYDPATDRWVCPLVEGVALGARLFNPSDRRGVAPWSEGAAAPAATPTPAAPP